MSKKKIEQLFSAAETGDAYALKALLPTLSVVDINTKSNDEDGQTPLYLAAYEGHVEVANILLEHGADATARNRWNSTPLHLAADANTPNIIKLLLEWGVDVNARNTWDRTPLYALFTNTKVDQDILYDNLKTLLTAGAEVNTKDKDGDTPLHVAIGCRRDIIELLIAKGADVNARNEDGDTPLHKAVQHNCTPEEIRPLLEYGAKIDVANNNGSTPLSLANGQDADGEVRDLLKKTLSLRGIARQKLNEAAVASVILATEQTESALHKLSKLPIEIKSNIANFMDKDITPQWRVLGGIALKRAGQHRSLLELKGELYPWAAAEQMRREQEQQRKAQSEEEAREPRRDRYREAETARKDGADRRDASPRR